MQKVTMLTFNRYNVYHVYYHLRLLIVLKSTLNTDGNDLTALADNSNYPPVFKTCFLTFLCLIFLKSDQSSIFEVI